MSGPALDLRFDPEWRITLFTLVMLPLMILLGWWQLQRAGEKADLVAMWEQRQARHPAPLQDIRAQPRAWLAYRPVQMSGTFLPEAYFLLDNRIHAGRFGYEVLGILALDGEAGAVLVNRGWIAADPARLETPEIPQPAGRVSVTGHVYVAPGKPYLLAPQQLQPGWPKRIQAVEMEKLAAPVTALTSGGVFPYPVRIDARAPGALTVDWQVINVSPDKHRGYALQWFTMAAVLCVFYLLRCSNLWQWLTRRNKKS